jgi:glutamate-5-semialdehyde dehydrogenase
MMLAKTQKRGLHKLRIDKTMYSTDNKQTMTEQPAESPSALIERLARDARTAYMRLAEATPAQKNRALKGAAKAMRADMKKILAANEKDMEAGSKAGMSKAMLDRLELNEKRVLAMAKSIEDIAKLADPVGHKLASFKRPNGLVIERVSVPLGVIGIIYESRPNVTADAGALCVKSGNAVILRGGSDSFHSSHSIAACMRKGLKAAELPESAIQLMPSTDRELVGAMLTATGLIDVIIPRGGKSLTERVRVQSRVPTLLHLDGNCHTYIHAKADPKMAFSILMNAKMRRTGICGATETLLIDKAALHLLPKLAEALIAEGCELRGDAAARKADARIRPATEEDWTTEYLDAILAIKTVNGVKEAVEHINRYGSHHTEAIVTRDAKAAALFLKEVDSAIVMHNASTQFADGGEFGFGAEIGISTGRLHARGPVGVEQLTTYKYVVRGKGQIRPK